MSRLRSLIDELTFRIAVVLAPYNSALDALAAIPGIDRKTAEDLVAEIGLDLEQFPTEKNLASWTGICPGNNESAGKKKSSKTNHGNKLVKSTITEAAWAATRTKGTYYAARYHRLAARRGKKRALVAVGHSILKAVWHILHDNVSYSELGADYLTEKVAERRKSYLQNELKSLGYNVSLTKMEALPQTA